MNGAAGARSRVLPASAPNQGFEPHVKGKGGPPGKRLGPTEGNERKRLHGKRFRLPCRGVEITSGSTTLRQTASLSTAVAKVWLAAPASADEALTTFPPPTMVDGIVAG
jgi:hypothetical protein